VSFLFIGLPIRDEFNANYYVDTLDLVVRSAVATNACSVTRSLKLSSLTSSPFSTWMSDHQGRLSAVNLCPFVGVDLNL